MIAPVDVQEQTERSPEPVPEPAPVPPAQVAPLLGELQSLDADTFDPLAVTALLESTGLRDLDARQRYAEPDMFALGAALYPAVPVPWQAAPELDESHVPLLRQVRTFVGRYVTGLAYLAPVVAQIAVFIWLGYSLFASGGFTVRQATVVAMATLGSLLVTAPAVQGMARRGNYYLNVNNPRLAWLSLWQMTAFGVISLVVTAALTALVWGILGGEELGRFLGYFLLLGVLWLVVARVDVARRRWTVSVASLAGVVVVYLLAEQAGLSISHAQWAGIAAVDALLIGLSEWQLRRWSRNLPLDLRDVRPLPWRALVARIWPIFLYGLLYYAFLFTDRLVAWTTPPVPGDGFLGFRGDYEAGLAWALMVLFLCTSVLEYTIRVFSEKMIPTAGALRAGDDAGFARVFLRLYRRQALVLLVVSLASLAAGYALLALPFGGNWEVFSTPVVRRVFLLAGTGYLLFTGGLFSAVFLQSLSRPATVARWLFVAIVVDAATGWLAAHTWGYEWAVLGIIAGGAAFLVLCSLSAVRTLHRGPFPEREGGVSCKTGPVQSWLFSRFGQG